MMNISMNYTLLCTLILAGGSIYANGPENQATNKKQETYVIKNLPPKYLIATYLASNNTLNNTDQNNADQETEPTINFDSLGDFDSLGYLAFDSFDLASVDW